ncbi:hypothetical protein E2C01_039416 [Portunus trituberculatus]|uniref:Uncharacterized protein n=1 Tax=Portunus trituberculatus TaxID=210409 RepID=A0A5B7FKP8_PORTR|nr:hypothetical protein [Portunus trituberculatus]
MAESNLNILERSLATSHGSCMADTNLHFLGSGAAARHARLMGAANPTPINTARGTRSTSGAAAGHGRPMAVANPTPRKQCEKYPGHRALPYLCQKPRHGSYLLCLCLQWTPVPSQPRDRQHQLAPLALPSAQLHSYLARNRLPVKPETGNQRRGNPVKRRERGKADPTSPPSYTCVYAAVETKEMTSAYQKTKPSSSQYNL